MSYRYSIRDSKDALNYDMEEQRNDAQYQYDLYMAALDTDGVEYEVDSDVDQLSITISSDSIRQLRDISVEAKMPWLKIMTADGRELASAEEARRKGVKA